MEKWAIAYGELSGIVLDLNRPLGHGTDGTVWTADKKTAVKVLRLKRNYGIEKEPYQRFKSNKIIEIKRFAVPELVGFNDDLLVIEMRIVTPPFILDFAKAWLDGPADFTPEKMEN